jgi:hypothetical protein
MIWYIGMFGSMATAVVLGYYKPDTRCVFSFSFLSFVVRADILDSIQTWALAEAKKRMEERGEPTDYVPRDD